MKPNVENPVCQGPIEFTYIPREETGSRQLLKLAKNGDRFLTHTENTGKGPAVYQDFTKPREAHHAADLNRPCRKEAVKIEGHGGRNLRVVLDYELKKYLHRDFAKVGEDRTFVDGKHVIAESHVLWVPVPDVRIEYETADGEWARADLELATGHYRGRNLTEKVRARFSRCAHADDVSKLRKILNQRELTVEILSL
jgi:hypothetical protein